MTKRIIKRPYRLYKRGDKIFYIKNGKEIKTNIKKLPVKVIRRKAVKKPANRYKVNKGISNIIKDAFKNYGEIANQSNAINYIGTVNNLQKDLKQKETELDRLDEAIKKAKESGTKINIAALVKDDDDLKKIYDELKIKFPEDQEKQVIEFKKEYEIIIEELKGEKKKLEKEMLDFELYLLEHDKLRTISPIEPKSESASNFSLGFNSGSKSGSSSGNGKINISKGFTNFDLINILKPVSTQMNFIGVFDHSNLSEFLSTTKLNNFCLIYNSIDAGLGVSGHWKAINVQDYTFEHFDSLAKPIEDSLQALIMNYGMRNDVKIKFKYNKIKVQKANENNCGIWVVSFLFIRRLLKQDYKDSSNFSKFDTPNEISFPFI